ncbi:MAG TPA: AAA family ATPase [Oscillatoriaceae cyanobacterium M33_DOE_052]|uniref:ATP-binding protein n=1 Tax=Planktothricoides sp. SpSt-374 TaxID=2282167 RepID=A0A7C3VJR8_9CYAN|nr:AAA family ATPase [Oscillatoriaceae cyanobacterium M33_DOE_052]
MKLDLLRFFKACNPSKTIDMAHEEERKYYIDFASVRGSDIIRELRRTIELLSRDEPTCQLFTGHIGCGKSTELLRLKDELEKKGFHVIYFESSQELDMADVDITEILLAIARQVSESLEKIKPGAIQPRGFRALLQGAANILATPIQIEGSAALPGIGTINASTEGEIGFSLPGGIGSITAKTKDSPKLRHQLRQYLEPRTNNILEAINNELLAPAIPLLQSLGKTGLVVIVDNLDRVDSVRKPTGRTQPEYLFVDRGEQLRRLSCHVVYTIPLGLIFSNDFSRLVNRFGVKPKVLPMVPVQQRQLVKDPSINNDFEPGLNLLRQMVLARAFPDVPPSDRLALIPLVFDAPETLDRLCRISGGHVRNLLGLLYSCLQQEDPPFSRQTLENTIKEYRDDLVAAITEDEWELLFQALEQKTVQGDEDYQTLLRSMFLFEYRDDQGRWYWINPALAEAARFKSWLSS